LAAGAPLVYQRSPSTSPALEAPSLAPEETLLASYLITEPIVRGSQAGGAELPDTLKVTTYTVRAGDSLSSIAQKTGLRIDTLISFNNIKRARSLMTGTELQIPNADGLRYVVRRGDSLTSIAARSGTDLNGLLDWNNLDSDVIRVGQSLFLPGAALTATQRDMVLGRLFIYPTRGQISSRFGWRRNPFTGVREHHNGLDIQNRTGTPVNAAMAGRVAMVGVNPVYGKYVILQHAEGFQSLYAHLSRIQVERGMQVGQGQRIGSMGNTGYSTGSHLHFTIFRSQVPVDPLGYLH
jgi:murein DD-endopeptidase MepM/ murein hydrolase activator NlpD